MLAFAVAFECFTSIISHIVLQHHLLLQSDETMARFWQWHMVEELEHQSVLIQLYHEMGGGYFRRVSILTLVLFYYCFFGFRIDFGLLRVDRASYIKGLMTACGRQSFFIRSLIKVLRCYKRRYVEF